MKIFKGQNDVSHKAEVSNVRSKLQAGIWAAVITVMIFLLKSL